MTYDMNSIQPPPEIKRSGGPVTIYLPDNIRLAAMSKAQELSRGLSWIARKALAQFLGIPERDEE